MRSGRRQRSLMTASEKSNGGDDVGEEDGVGE